MRLWGGERSQMNHVFTGVPSGVSYDRIHLPRSLYNVANDATNNMLNTTSPALLRAQILQFHSNYGTQATIDAYHISKATIYRWRKPFLQSHKDPTTLIPKSKAPRNKRTMHADYRVIEFIKKLREKRGRIGKEKIKPLLDEYCATNNILSVSTSKIGRIISKYLSYSPSKVYHGSKAYNRYKQKIKKAPKPEQFGYIEVDTIAKFSLGIKTYIFNAIDVKLKFQFSYAYKQNNSVNAVDFFKKFESVYPILGGIKIVHTDNGGEYLGNFAKYLKQKKIKQVFIYPRCPKINGCVERANRSLREDFIDRKGHLLARGIEHFNKELMEHLVWYNTKRVHKALKNISPIDYLLLVLPQSHLYWTHTYLLQI